ncbi:MAG TPA: DUF2851 family protein [Candidatus Limnocylindrales bacterium]|jgi:hypothetical protein|nr:DUF2851 family protein [Candidatus Limnocylindrales bacterium]
MVLDIHRLSTQKQAVFGVLNNFYAHFRVQSGMVPLLHEDNASPPERLLQAIWQHQRLLRESLSTADGEPVRVLHPGFHNLEGGPDFRNAVIQFGADDPRTGDVEVDLRSSGWRAHGHDRNPAFQKVILHVIWEFEPRSAPNGPPLLILRALLDAPLGELSLWLGGEIAQVFPDELRGRCCAPLRRLSSGQLLDLLHQAAQVRLRSKAAQFQARARRVGWEQSLWEGLFRALGYKHNVWPMQRLAELRPAWSHNRVEFNQTGAGARQPEKHLGEENPGGTELRAPLLALQARLFGLSGLLPSELTRRQIGADNYLRRVWDQWWRDRDAVLGDILPRTMWRLHGLRPANHPHRRLALAANWAAANEVSRILERWCAGEPAPRELTASLLEALQVAHDEFWSWHWTLNSARLKREQPLLGASRVTDLAVNVVLPWLWMRAVEGKSESVQRRLEERYFNWPAAQDNSVLRLARERLLGGAARRALPDAAAQQGLIQIVRDFCDHSNAICDQCKLPDLVREFVANE